MNLLSDPIEGELASGERVLWSGQPRQGVYFHAADLLLVPFSLVWCGFALFWEYSVIKGGAPFFFALFGIPFVGIGLYLVVGRFFVDAWQRAKTHYAVTDQRILIISGLFSRRIRSLNLRTLSELSLSEKRSGVGTIFFDGCSPFSFLLRGASSWPSMSRHIGPHFEQIAEARTVYQMIRKTQQEVS